MAGRALKQVLSRDNITLREILLSGPILGTDAIPWLEKTAPNSAAIEQRLAQDLHAHWCA